jgi:hypothetical protein
VIVIHARIEVATLDVPVGQIASASNQLVSNFAEYRFREDP